MVKGIWRHQAVKQICVAIGYALAYFAIRPYSDAHWSLTYGLRFVILLFLPYRYWFAVAAGEIAPLVWGLVECISVYGTVTATIWSFPPVATAMPIVWFCRKRLGLFPSPRVIDVKVLLICVVGCSMCWASVVYFGMLFLHGTANAKEHVSIVMLGGFFVGIYVALLSLGPWPLLAYVSIDQKQWQQPIDLKQCRKLLRLFTAPSALSDLLIVCLPMMLLLSWASLKLGAHSAVACQIALFLPVGWLALRHGWRGAAISGPLAAACISIVTKSAPIPIVIQAQAILAFAITAIFLLGARVTSYRYIEENERERTGNALRVAQQSIYQSETQLRQTSHALETVGASLLATQNHVISRISNTLTPSERIELINATNEALNRISGLAESLHPVAWRDRGLPAALRESISLPLDEAGIAYTFTMQGHGLSQMTNTLRHAIYRFACRAVSNVVSNSSCTHIGVTLRGGNNNGHRWAIVRVIGTITPGTNDASERVTARHNLSARLNVSNSDLLALNELAAIYEGTVHTKVRDGTASVTVLLHDTPGIEKVRQARARDSKYWVR